MLRRQDSNLDLTAPKAVVLPLHHSGSPRHPSRAAQVCQRRKNGSVPASDEVDRIVEDWSRERPDVDFAPLQVLSRVARLAKHLDRARRQAFAASGLEPWEFDVLAALRRAGAPYQLSPKALLQQTLVSSGTMTNRIDRLVGRRLVERRTDPHDGRGVLVVMTSRGAEAVDAAISELLAGEADLLEGLSKADQERLSVLLRKLSLDFDEPVE
jgi:DNA-binding MarR family transcriptional regulator